MRLPLPYFIQQSALDARQPFDNLTHVELTFRTKMIEHWLRFGDPIERTIIDKRRCVASFKPGQIFAFVRWASNDYGTIISRLDIVRTIDRGEPAGENAPDYLITLGKQGEGPFVGAARRRRTEKGVDFISVRIDDPCFGRPIFAGLFPSEHSTNLHNLYWTRLHKNEDRL